MGDRPVLRAITPAATPEEVAAIVAAIAALDAERQGLVARATGAVEPVPGEVSEWVHASRLTARRKGLVRGPWRIAGRIGRRSRA